MHFRFVVPLCLVSFFTITYGDYLVTTPRKWTFGTKSQVCVVLTDGVLEASDSLAISFNPLTRDPTIPHDKKIPLDLPLGESNTCISFDVPKTDNHKAEVTISGTLSGIPVDEKENVSISRTHARTFIQTDKYLYQSGQEVQFRALTLDGPFLNVLTEPYGEIYIENPAGTRIHQWLDVANPGIVHLSYTLGEEPEQGYYSIYARSADGRRDSTGFKVEEYVLPRYEVTINPVGTFLGSDPQITLELCAKYTFGQNVEANASLSVAVSDYRVFGNITLEKPIFGCEKFTYDTKELRFDDNNCHIRIRNVDATAKIVEQGTGTELFGKAHATVHRTALNFRDLSPEYIPKRFLPKFVSLEATFNDKKPAANEPMSVCTYYNNSEICKNMTTDRAGMLNFVTPGTTSGSIDIRALNYPRIERNWNDVMSESRYSKYQHTSETFTEVHNASLSIYSDEEIKCDHGKQISLVLPIIYIIEDRSLAGQTVSLYIQIMSRGQIQFSGSLPVHLKKTPLPFAKFPYLFKEQHIPSHIVMGQFDFVATLPPTISPKVKIVTWFLKNKGAVIADTKELDVTHCLDQNVGMFWSVEQGEPGSTADLILTAEPGSICSYGVVDRSVELLSNPNDPLKVDQLLNEVNSYDSRRWDGSNQLTLDYCLDKYNRTLDVPIEITKPKITEIPENPEEVDDFTARTKRSFYRYGRSELEAIDIFLRAGFFVFSNLDLESEYCEDRINRALKKKITEAQQNSRPPADGISNKVFSAARPARPRPMAASAGFGGAAAPQAFEAADLESDFDVAEGPEEFGESADEEGRERTYFPETWLWDLVDIPASGKAVEPQTLPDTITKWVGKSVCVHASKGLGISAKSSLVTFTSFFIDLTLPASVKRGEIFPLKISVFNYENHDLPVKVNVDKDGGYAFAEKGEMGVRMLCIPPNSQRTETIKIKATEIGDIEIGVNAAVDASNKCGPANPTYKSDRIVRSLPVEAEGFVRERVISNYICAEDVKAGPISPVKIEVPTNIVADSARAWINVLADLFAIEDLGRLVNLPFGCGEQNMVRFAPNIFVARYLDAVKEGKPVRDQAIRYLQTGYQRQLSFLRNSGSFSTFGNYDDQGSTWLTAFVLKYFALAKPYIRIDNNILNRATNWLKKRQNLTDGCFEQRGNVINKKLLGGLDVKSSLMTAYVLASLVESGEQGDSSVITTAVDCILSDIPSSPSNDHYRTALTAYSLSLLNDLKGKPRAKVLVDELLSSAVEDASTMRWDIPDTNNHALEIETAAYALLAMLNTDPEANYLKARKVVRWLYSQRNNFGGFVSTQDTVLGLEALAAFESLRPRGNLDLNVNTTDGGSLNGEFMITNANKLLQQREMIPNLPTDVQIGVTGTGCALVQSVLRYNILAEDKSAAFNIALDVTPVMGDCSARYMKVCTSYTLADEASNMAVVEIYLLTGYVADRATLRQAVEASPIVKRYEFDHGKVTFYLDEVTAKDVCVNFKVFRDIEIDNLQERHIMVYDYYQTEYKSEHKYNFNLASCNEA